MTLTIQTHTTILITIMITIARLVSYCTIYTILSIARSLSGSSRGGYNLYCPKGATKLNLPSGPIASLKNPLFALMMLPRSFMQCNKNSANVFWMSRDPLRGKSHGKPDTHIEVVVVVAVAVVVVVVNKHIIQQSQLRFGV